MKHLSRLIVTALAVIMMLPTVSAQTRPVSIDVKDMQLSEILKSISAQSDYRFVYSNSAIRADRRMTIKLSGTDISKVMDDLLKGTGITYTILDRQIALSPSGLSGEKTEKPGKRSKTVRGKVTDSNGEALPGADVFVDGTTNGAVTDLDGNYTIIVPDDPNTVLVFNFIGMKQQKTEVGEKDKYDITLTMDTQYLEQVVVTGYQTLSRERSAGSFAMVEGAQIQDKGNAHGDIIRSLEGTVAGLNVNTSAEGTSYLIRGVTSINSSTEPLYIVDGVPMSKDQVTKMINPNDVSSVTFLKDATAASIWGAKAANGVMVLTTRTGTRPLKNYTKDIVL